MNCPAGSNSQSARCTRMMQFEFLRRFGGGLIVLCLLLNGARGDDALTRATFTEAGGRVRTVTGKILVDAQDNSFLMMGRDGRLWSVTPKQLHDRTTTDEAFSPLSREELTAD